VAGQGGASAQKSPRADEARLIKQLKEDNVAGMKHDIRDNRGGSREAAHDLSGHFIEDGPDVQVKNFAGKIRQS